MKTKSNQFVRFKSGTVVSLVFFLMVLACGITRGGTFYSADAFVVLPNGTAYVDSMTVDMSGNLYVAFQSGGFRAITKNTYSGSFVLVNGVSSSDLETDRNGDVYSLNGLTGQIDKILPDGFLSTYATIPGAKAIAFDHINALYSAVGNIVMRTDNAAVTTQYAAFSSPILGQGIAFDSRGNLFAKTIQGLERVTPNGSLSTMFTWDALGARSLGLSEGMAIDENDDIFVNYSAFVGISHNPQMFTVGFSQETGLFGTTQRGFYYGTFTYTPLSPVPVMLVPEPALNGVIIMTISAFYFFKRR